MKKLGMPYMGNKRRLASRIIDKILEDNPNTEYFYDLFGGGGSVSFEALQRPQIKQVFYNEFNTGVVALLRDIRDNGVTDKYFQWIDRETFFAHKNDDDWFGGLCKVVWSFGNQQTGYLFGKHIEEAKRLGHHIVVNKDLECLAKLSKHLGIQIPDTILEHDRLHDRRLAFYRFIKSQTKRFGLEKLQQLEQLQQLQQLQQLEQLEQLGRLEISNLSYEQVQITTPRDKTIIYLDPPYKNKKKYQLNVDHERLHSWIEESPFTIYLSSYESDFSCVLEMKHSLTIQGSGHSTTIEKLFTNKEV